MLGALEGAEGIPGRGARERATAIELGILRLAGDRRVEIHQGPPGLSRLAGGHPAQKVHVGPGKELDAAIEVDPCPIELPQVDVVASARIVVVGPLWSEKDRLIDVRDLFLARHPLLLAVERGEVLAIGAVMAAPRGEHRRGCNPDQHERALDVHSALARAGGPCARNRDSILDPSA